MISNCIWLSIFCLTIIFAGHVVVSVLLGNERRPWPEVVALSLGIGSGVFSLLLFWSSLAGFKPTRGVVFALFAAFAVSQLKLLAQKRWPMWISSREGESRDNRDRICLFIFLGVIAGCVLLVLLNAIGLPVYEWDSFAIWALKAKVLALDSLASKPGYFQDASMGFSHLDYPLLVPFLVAGSYGAMGEVNDQLGKMVFPLLYVAFGFQLFSALRWKLGRVQSLVLTALGMSTPTVIRWAGAGVADVVLVLYYLGAISYCLRWMESEQNADLFLSILFAAFAVFTKNEGLAFALLICVCMFIHAAVKRSKSKALGAGICLIVMLTLNVPWFWWGHSLPRIHENYGGRLRPAIILENWNRLGVILADFLKQAWAWPRWGAVWLLLILSLIFGYRAFRSRSVRVLWLLLVGQLAIYVLIFVVTPWDVRELLDSALDRLFLQTMPVVVLLIGFHWNEMNQQAQTPIVSTL